MLQLFDNHSVNKQYNSIVTPIPFHHQKKKKKKEKKKILKH